MKGSRGRKARSRPQRGHCAPCGECCGSVEVVESGEEKRGGGRGDEGEVEEVVHAQRLQLQHHAGQRCPLDLRRSGGGQGVVGLPLCTGDSRCQL